MPRFRVHADVGVTIEELAKWFTDASNDQQIEFLNEVAKHMQLDFNGPGQIHAIAHPDRSLNIKLTKQAEGMILMLADWIRDNPFEQRYDFINKE